MTALRRDATIFVAGHRGLVGSALIRRLRSEGFERLLTVDRDQLDLRDPAAVERWFSRERPEVVFLAAGTVGGILANQRRPADFLYDNLMIHASMIPAAHRHGTRRLLYLGSSCIYPREAPQPLREESLLGGPLEPTNEAYAVAKISGIKLCESFRRQYGSDFLSVLPTNLYGPGDNFSLEDSHVLPALLRKFHAARLSGADRFELWGTGRARREFLHVDDLADACLFLMLRYDGHLPINIGTGEDLSIRELASKIAAVTGFEGEVVYDSSRPDGMPRKRLDVSRLHELGWRHKIDLDDGIRETYDWMCRQWEAIAAGERPRAMTATVPVSRRGR